MTKEELQTRIQKKEADIAKIEKRISKWSAGLRPADIDICKPFGDCYYGEKPRDMHWSQYHGTPEFQQAYNNYENYIASNKDIPESEDWNKGPNINELHNAYRDLGEAKHTLQKYQTELNNLTEYAEKEKIEVIWNFLQDWRARAYEYYLNQVQKLFKLKSDYDDAYAEYMNSDEYKKAYERYVNRKYAPWNIEYTLEKNFKNEYYDSIDATTFRIYQRGGKADIELLNKILDKEVKKKYEKLEAEVTEKAGNILDASGLHINARGEINGVIVGDKNTVNLWLTFVPGNIQCPHYRGYCHIAK